MTQRKDQGWSAASVLEYSERSFARGMAAEAAGTMHQERRNAAVRGDRSADPGQMWAGRLCQSWDSCDQKKQSKDILGLV